MSDKHANSVTTLHHVTNTQHALCRTNISVTILFCPTGPAYVVPRYPAIERAALQPQTTSCLVHGQHSEPVPFCESPLRKFGPGHPGAIRDPWSQHCYAAPATELPRHRTTRMTRSHAPFAQTFPSANETATPKLHGTMIPVILFCPLLMHFNENITYIFFVLYIT